MREARKWDLMNDIPEAGLHSVWRRGIAYPLAFEPSLLLLLVRQLGNMEADDEIETTSMGLYCHLGGKSCCRGRRMDSG
jgi:hypothetical protein